MKPDVWKQLAATVEGGGESLGQVFLTAGWADGPTEGSTGVWSSLG
jgi:hypothetical protein